MTERCATRPLDALRAGALASLLVLATASCGGIGAMLGTAKASPVMAARLEPGGRGLFVVRPPSAPDGCTISAGNPTPLACTNAYLVSCDATLPESEPFCRVTPEIGPVRESIYPARLP